MKPFIHAKQDVKLFGGNIDDYLDIHEFIDSSYHVLPDIRHRALLHNQFGLMMVERLFGQYRTNSDGKMYSPRQVAENHVLADLGRIPTVENYFVNMEVQPWMSGTLKKRRTIKFNRNEGVKDGTS